MPLGTWKSIAQTIQINTKYRKFFRISCLDLPERLRDQPEEAFCSRVYVYFRLAGLTTSPMRMAFVDT